MGRVSVSAARIAVVTCTSLYIQKTFRRFRRSKRFFFEEKKQKTFAHWPCGRFSSAVQDRTFFGYFFSKK
jgi:hypothetical protein